MEDSNYFVVEISGIKASQEDLLVAELFEIGAAGVEEALQFEQKDRKYLPELVNTEVRNLKVYFETKPEQESLSQLLQQYPDTQFAVKEQPLVDWLSEWKKQWKAFRWVGPYWIVPDWEKQEFQQADAEMILIEPGMAFGTGTHATTQIAGELIFDLLSSNNFSRLTDIGTGSGILAILADKLEVETVTAYDNDVEAKRVFTENTQKNSAKNCHWLEQWEQQKNVEVCVANIIDGVLLELKPQFVELDCEFYIFTGVLAEREQDFLKEMLLNWPLELIERKQKDEWVGFCFRKSQ